MCVSSSSSCNHPQFSRTNCTHFFFLIHSLVKCRKKRHTRSSVRKKIPFTKSPWKKYAESNKRNQKQQKKACGIRWTGNERILENALREIDDCGRSVVWRTRVPADIHRFVDYTSLTPAPRSHLNLKTMQISPTTKGHLENIVVVVVATVPCRAYVRNRNPISCFSAILIRLVKEMWPLFFSTTVFATVIRLQSIAFANK